MTDDRAAETQSPSPEKEPASPQAAPERELPAEPPSPVRTPTRISGTWLGVVVGAFVLVILLVFVLQNTKSVKVSFFTASGHLPLGVALLFAAAGGVILAAGAASARLLQIRRRLGGARSGSDSRRPGVGQQPAGGLAMPATDRVDTPARNEPQAPSIQDANNAVGGNPTREQD